MRAVLAMYTVTLGIASLAGAGQPAPHKLNPVPIQQVRVEDGFWSPKIQLWRETTIPDAFSRFENDRGGAISNFDLVRGQVRACSLDAGEPRMEPAELTAVPFYASANRGPCLFPLRDLGIMGMHVRPFCDGVRGRTRQPPSPSRGGSFRLA